MKHILYIYGCLILSIVSLLCGVLCMKYPEKVLQFQKAFYFKINWRIEPVSMEKELKNTRWMGGIMIILALASFLIIAFWKHKPFDIAFLFR